MRISPVLALSLISAAGTPTPAMAQPTPPPVRVPRCFIMGDQPSSVPIYSQFTGMVLVSLRDLPSENGNPVEAAQQAADRVLHRVYTTQMVPFDSVSLMLHGFGHDDVHSEDTSGTNYAPLLRFFQDADRLENRGFNIDDTDFPVQLDGSGTNRTYRHPFLSRDFNPADPYNTAATSTTAVLRRWMRDFIAEYTRLQAERLISHPLQPLPTPSRMHYDTEPFMCIAPHRNNVWFLNYISQQAAIWGDGTTQNPGWDVPGHPAGTSLYDLFSAAQAQYGWPSIISLNTLESAEHHTNRSEMALWYDICQRAEAAQMRATAYDEIKANWASCIVGNYGDARYDGESANTGWHMARVRDATLTNETDDTFAASNLYPRGHIHRQPFGAKQSYLASATHDPQGEFRWTGSRYWTFGDVDSPELYHASKIQLLGYSGLGWQRPLVQGGPDGHQQPDLYLPGQPLHGGTPPGEIMPGDPFPTTLRLCRLEAEAVIGYGGGSHEDRFYPWLQMPYSDYPTAYYAGGHQGFEWHVVTPVEVRRMLALMRAKRAPEVLFYTWSNATAPQWTVTSSWNAAIEEFKGVYAPRVYEYTRVLGTKPPGSPADHTSLLEFTLQDIGYGTVVGLQSTPTNGLNSVTQLVVRLNNMEEYAHGTLDITIECSSSAANTSARTEVWDFSSGGWVIVPVPESSVGKYLFYTPDRSSRRTFDTVGLSGTFIGSTAPDAGRVFLRLTHTAPANFVSKYDLVQVVPTPPLYPGDGEGLRADDGDATQDDEVNLDDLVFFVDHWNAQSPAADLDMNAQVDDADLSRFLDAFTDGD